MSGLPRDDGVVVRLDAGDPAAGELQHGGVPAGLLQEPQRLDGEVVVLLVEPVAARVGDREDLGRPAAAPGAVDPRLAGLDRTLGQHLVEVATDGGRGQLQTLREDGRRAGAELEQRPGHPLAGG